MLSYIPRRSSIILVIPIILYLVLGSCRPAPTSPTTTMPESEPESTKFGTDTPTMNATALESLASATLRPTPLSVESLSPIILELILGNQGFAQNGNLLAYGFEIENPNTMAVSGNEFQILAYDANGILAGSKKENIALLLPDQRLGIADSLRLDDNQTIAQIQLQITTGDILDLEVAPDLIVLGVNYRPSEIYNRVSGLLVNEGDIDLEDIRISAIAYSRDSRIVGAGYTFLSFLPAGTETGVDIVLTTSELIDRVELYPRVSLPALLSSSIQRPAFSLELGILDHGFSQGGIEVGYGFLIANPNALHTLKNTEYRVTFFNDEDNVIAVDQGYIELLVPQQIYGVGDHVFVDDGETVDRMEVLSRPNAYVPAIPGPILAAEKVSVITDTLGTLVRGEIINPYQVALENVHLSAVVYDNAGQIVGGGQDWIDHIPLAGTAAAEVWVIAPGDPVVAELYASITEIILE